MSVRSVVRAIGTIALMASVVPAQTTIRRMAPATFTVQHVIEAADLQASPMGVTAGEAVTFRFKLKNTGTTTAASIPWALEANGVAIGAGLAPGLKAGESWESSKGWSATAGSHTVRLVVDPAGTASASGAPVAARSKQLAYVVAGLPALEVRQIDWDAARSAGMTSAHGLVNPTACQGMLLPVGSAAYRSNLSNVSFSGYVGWVHVMLQCPLPTGARMLPVVYDNLVLRNGWHVKDVRIVELSRYGTATWQYVGGPPATGSDRPRTAFSVWANAGGAIEFVVRMDIEGPRGTNPYR